MSNNEAWISSSWVLMDSTDIERDATVLTSCAILVRIEYWIIARIEIQVGS